MRIIQRLTDNELAVLGSDGVRQQSASQRQERLVPRQDAQLTSDGEYRHVITTLYIDTSHRLTQWVCRPTDG